VTLAFPFAIACCHLPGQLFLACPVSFYHRGGPLPQKLVFRSFPPLSPPYPSSTASTFFIFFFFPTWTPWHCVLIPSISTRQDIILHSTFLWLFVL
ncbi:hypothetical protein L9F63_009737, partial [Diploptera punctata]